MGGFSNFALSFSIISIITGIVGQFGYGLQNGGPAEMAFGWPLVTFFTLFVALSMGELASGFPTWGALYHWSLTLGGRGWAWFTAWFNIVGLITIIARCRLSLRPKPGPARAYTRVCFAGLQCLPELYLIILLSHGLINHFGIRLVAWLTDLSVTVHVVGVVVIAGGFCWLWLTSSRPSTSSCSPSPRRDIRISMGS